MGAAGGTPGLATRIATVGGVGDLPVGPGTWGSAVGLGLGWLGAQAVGAPWSVILLTLTGLVGSRLCTRAERELARHDPPSVVLDEVWAMAVVVMAPPQLAWDWPRLVVAFGLFRLFDITKPFPLPQMARWPAGVGVMADDLGAAVYTRLLLWLLMRYCGL